MTHNSFVTHDTIFAQSYAPISAKKPVLAGSVQLLKARITVTLSKVEPTVGGHFWDHIQVSDYERCLLMGGKRNAMFACGGTMTA